LAFAVLAVGGAATGGCGRDCNDPLPPGTRFHVTVPEAYSLCHVTFEAGAMYDLVAGPIWEDNYGCEQNRAEGPPVFTTMDFTIEECRVDASNLGIDCITSIPGCPDGNPSNVRWFYMGLPKEPGETVSTSLRMIFSAGACTGVGGCMDDIPVTVRR
jgi:hypothetical protein